MRAKKPCRCSSRRSSRVSELLFTTLINEMVVLPSRIVLVLDDYSVIHSEIIDEFISRLVRIAPQQLHLVLITRRNPPLPLPQLRAADAITEIRSQDLRFSHDETTNYLSRALATPLGASQIAALELRYRRLDRGPEISGAFTAQ